MAYRDDLEAMRARLAQLEAENDRLRAQLRGADPARRREVDARWCSVPGGEPTTIAIVNASPRKIGVYWLSYDGRERTAGTLVPSGEIRVETYIGFCWRFVDDATGAVLEHARVEQPRQVLVYDE